MGDLVEAGGIWAQRFECAQGFSCEPMRFLPALFKTEDSRVGRLVNLSILSCSFPKSRGRLSDIENIVDHLKGEAEGLSEFC